MNQGYLYFRNGRPRPPPNVRSWIAVEQVRAARAMLGWSRDQAADACGVPRGSWKSLENKRGRRRMHFVTMRKIVAGFEAAGVTFTENGIEAAPGTFAQGAGGHSEPLGAIGAL